MSALVFALDQGAGGMPYFRDRMYYFWPLYEACRPAVAEGQVPLWNPFVSYSQPLLATWQAAVASPLSFKLGLWLSTLALAGRAGYGILLALNARGRREYGLAVIPAPSPGRRGFARS